MAAVSIAKLGVGHCWVLLLTVAPRRALFGMVVTVHSVPMVCINPSGMFCARQGGRDRVHSQNPVVAGLRDPKTPLSAQKLMGACSILGM